MKRFGTLLLALAMLAMAAPAAQAAYPDRPITIIVPFGAGGDTDLVARLVASHMSKELGQNVLVQNIVGASGVSGLSSVVSSRPDGYTLGMTPCAPLVMHPHMRKVPYNLDSFTFMGRVINAPNVVVVQKSSPWNSFEDMIKDMKDNPGKHFWGSAGVGSVPYFALMDLFQTFDVNTRHVPFSGDAGAFQALAGNRIQVYTTSAGVLDKHEVKPLLILSPERAALLPELQTVAEFDKPVYYSQWIPLLGPKGLPEDVTRTLESTLAKICMSQDFIDSMRKLSLEVDYLNAAGAKIFAEEESARNEVTIKRIMATTEQN